MSITFKPTLPKSRIELLDILRGIAIVGVLLSNILIMSGFLFTPFVDLEGMHLATVNHYLFITMSSIFVGKFYPILMLLFGAGLFMQFQKSEAPGFAKFFTRRTLLLLAIGIVHLTFWAGDVVSVYAILAFFLLPFRKQKPKTYLFAGILMFVIHLVVASIQTYWPVSTSNVEIEHMAYFQLHGIDSNELISAVQHDGFAGLRLITGAQFEFLWTITRYIKVIPMTLGLFFLGAYLYGSGFFTKKAHQTKYIIIFLSIGLTGAYLMYYVSPVFKILDNLFLALTYISLCALLIRTRIGNKLLRQLSPLGRMALTNYIMQSIICISIFYGVGLGYFSILPLYVVYMIAILILVFQVLFSRYYLKKFQFGPIEMIWRKLSYSGIKTSTNQKTRITPTIY